MSARALERLGTERMTGEPLRSEHAAELGVLLRDPHVVRTLSPHTGAPDDERIRAMLARNREHWERHGFGMWLLRDRETGKMVGRGGLQHTSTTGTDEIEVGWAIMPQRWGQGLATELAHASIEIAFGELGLEHVIAYTLASNRASRRVMAKAGLAYERDFEHVGLPHVIYRRSARAAC